MISDERITIGEVDLTQYMARARMDVPKDAVPVDFSEFTSTYDFGVRVPRLARVEMADGTAYWFDEEESDALMAAGNRFPHLALQFLTERPRDPE